MKATDLLLAVDVVERTLGRGDSISDQLRADLRERIGYLLGLGYRVDAVTQIMRRYLLVGEQQARSSGYVLERIEKL